MINLTLEREFTNTVLSNKIHQKITDPEYQELISNIRLKLMFIVSQNCWRWLLFKMLIKPEVQKKDQIAYFKFLFFESLSLTQQEFYNNILDYAIYCVVNSSLYELKIKN